MQFIVVEAYVSRNFSTKIKVSPLFVLNNKFSDAHVVVLQNFPQIELWHDEDSQFPMILGGLISPSSSSSIFSNEAAWIVTRECCFQKWNTS